MDHPDWTASMYDHLNVINPIDTYPSDVLCGSQVLGLFMKKILFTKYSCFNVTVQLLVPSFLIIMMLNTIQDPFQKYHEEPALKITLNSYLNDPVGIMTAPITILGYFYASHFEDPAVPRMLEINNNISDYVMNHVKNVPEFRMKYLVGASLNEDPLVVWFNNQPYHTIPLAINLLFNALLQELSINTRLTIVNHPLPELKGGRENMNDSKVQDVVGDVLFLVIFDLAMFIMVAYYAIDAVKERHTRLKLMQFISGISPFTFWMVTIMYDFCLVMISIGLVILVYVTEVTVFINSSIKLLFTLMSYTGSVLPFVYLRSFRYSNPTAAYLNILILGIIFGSLLQFAVSKGGPYVTRDEFIKNLTTYILQCIPFYNLAFTTEHLWLVSIKIQK